MGRPPSNGAPSFRFNPAEVAQMEDILTKHEGQVPSRDLLVALAERFSNSPERVGKTVVQMKQVWNWFQNRRYALRAKSEAPGKPTSSSATRDTPVRNVPSVPQQMAHSSGPRVVGNTSEAPVLEFEAKSARDGAWYDVQLFLSLKNLETSSPEALIRFAGFGPEEDEWVNVHKHVRQRSLPCEASECYVVAPGDLILCFQEGKEQALYFDAHVLDAQRRRHDVRGCRCRFLVRYDHDQSEEIVPLRKICRRPETDYRLQYVANETARSTSMFAEPPNPVVNLTSTTTSGTTNPNPGSVSSMVSPSPIISAGPSLRPPAPIQATIASTNSTIVRPPTPSITGPSGATTSPILLPSPTTKPISAMVSGRVPVVDTQTPAPFAEQKNVTVTGWISGPVTEMVTETPPCPEQKKVESDTPAQIPTPALEKVDCGDLAQIAMPDMKKFETDNSGQISAPVCEKVEVLEGDNPAQVSVPYQKMVEGDNVVAQVTVPDLKKVESDDTLAQISEADLKKDESDDTLAQISEADLKKDESDYPAQVQGTGPKDVGNSNDPALISSPEMNKAESGNLAQIPKPVPEADSVETVDPTPVVAPKVDKVDSNNPVLVLEPNKVEAENPAPVSASEVNNADTDNPTPLSLPTLNKVESDLPIAAPETNKADSADLGTPDVKQKAENTANAETHHEAEAMLTDTETAEPTGPTEL